LEAVYLWKERAQGVSRVGDGKSKKSFRETPKLLKSLKTAKSRDFWVQGIQWLSKTHDFAGEAISFRFGFVLASRERKFPFWDASDGQIGRQKVWNREKSFFLRVTR